MHYRQMRKPSHWNQGDVHNLRKVYHDMVPFQAVPSVSLGPVHLPVISIRMIGSTSSSLMP